MVDKEKDIQSSESHTWCRESTDGDETYICMSESDIFWGFILYIYYYKTTHHHPHFSAVEEVSPCWTVEQQEPALPQLRQPEL